MFKVRNYHFKEKNKIILKLITGTSLKKVGAEQQKAAKWC